jgi:hypothetical protein
MVMATMLGWPTATPGPEPGPGRGDHAAKHCGVLRRRVPLHRIPTIAVDAAVIKPPASLRCCNELAGSPVRGIRDLWVANDEENVGMLVAVEHDGIEAGAFVHGIKQVLEALDIALYED